jgi:hypothetical protein
MIINRFVESGRSTRSAAWSGSARGWGTVGLRPSAAWSVGADSGVVGRRPDGGMSGHSYHALRESRKPLVMRACRGGIPNR